jgi:hypothetical protein
VSAGFGIKGKTYHKILVEWMNAIYPCLEPLTGGVGQHSLVKVDPHMGPRGEANHLGGSSSLTHVRHFISTLKP